MRVFPITLHCGEGGVLTEQITRIIPHHAKDGWSVIYTDADPAGLMIRGDSRDLCSIWWQALEDIYESDMADPDLDDGLCGDADLPGDGGDPDD